MTGREKIEAALAPQGSAETPVVICYEGIYLRDHQDEFAPCPWWYLHVPDLERQLAYRRRALECTGQDWFELRPGASREKRRNLVVEERGGQVWVRDRRSGSERVLEKPKPGGWEVVATQPAVPAPRTTAEVERCVPLPSPGALDQALADGRWDLAVQMVREFGGTHYPLGYVIAPLWRCYELWGFEELMVLTVEQPELLRYAAERFLRAALHSVREQAAVGARGFWIEECMTDMLSPETFARFSLPALRELTAAIRDLGCHSIYYYCGNPHDRWDLLLATGADALGLEESKKGWTIDIEDVARRVGGRCTLLGNLDAINLLCRGSEAELRAEIARQIAAGRRNHRRFIMSLGSPVTPETPVARVRRYCELARELDAATT